MHTLQQHIARVGIYAAFVAFLLIVDAMVRGLVIGGVV